MSDAELKAEAGSESDTGEEPAADQRVHELTPAAHEIDQDRVIDLDGASGPVAADQDQAPTGLDRRCQW